MMSRVIDFINRIMYGKKSFNLNEYSTYGDVADAMIDSILNGNMDLVFGDMSTENGVGLLNAIAELSADSKPLESLSEYASFFLTHPNSASIEQLRDKGRINNIYSLIINSNDHSYEIGDKSWDLRKYMGTATQKDDIVSIIRSQIIPAIDEKKGDMTDALR